MGAFVIMKGQADLLELLVHCDRRAASRAACTAGSNSAISTAMIAITTSSSIRVKPRGRLRRIDVSLGLLRDENRSKAVDLFPMLRNRSRPSGLARGATRRFGLGGLVWGDRVVGCTAAGASVGVTGESSGGVASFPGCGGMVRYRLEAGILRGGARSMGVSILPWELPSWPLGARRVVAGAVSHPTVGNSVPGPKAYEERGTKDGDSSFHYPL